MNCGKSRALCVLTISQIRGGQKNFRRAEEPGAERTVRLDIIFKMERMLVCRAVQ
jgi:hypothetical protein